MRKCFKLGWSLKWKFYLPFFLIALFSFNSSLSAQQKVISAIVTDADSLPLQGVTVNVAILQSGIQNHQSFGLHKPFLNRFVKTQVFSILVLM